MLMPIKYEKVHCKTVLGNLGVLGTRFWTRHCFDPYSNCELNCAYCSTSTIRHTDMGESSVNVCAKTNAPQLLKAELNRLRAKGVVSIGLAMDAYQPIEKNLRLTRQILQVLKDHNCPFAIGTKSDLVLRDIDIISEASKKSPCLVSLSITTLDADLAKLMEPNASSPKSRLEAIRQLSQDGITTGVWLSPVLPFITDNDENITSIIDAAIKNGAQYILCGALDMRSPIGVLKFMNTHYPALIPKYEYLYKKSDGSYSYYPIESYLYDLYRRFISHCKRHKVVSYMPHFHTRNQALLFYIRNSQSLGEFIPLINYMSPSQEILQTINLRCKIKGFKRSTLKTLRYFPH